MGCSTRALFDKFVAGCLPGSAGKTAAGTGSPSSTVTPWRSPLNAQASGTSTTKSTGVVLNVPPTGQGPAARPTRSQGCDHGFACAEKGSGETLFGDVGLVTPNWDRRMLGSAVGLNSAPPLDALTSHPGESIQVLRLFVQAAELFFVASDVVGDGPRAGPQWVAEHQVSGLMALPAHGVHGAGWVDGLVGIAKLRGTFWTTLSGNLKFEQACAGPCPPERICAGNRADQPHRGCHLAWTEQCHLPW